MQPQTHCRKGPSSELALHPDSGEHPGAQGQRPALETLKLAFPPTPASTPLGLPFCSISCSPSWCHAGAEGDFRSVWPPTRLKGRLDSCRLARLAHSTRKAVLGSLLDLAWQSMTLWGPQGHLKRISSPRGNAEGQSRVV